MKKRILSAVVAFCLVFGSAAALPRGVFISSTSITVPSSVKSIGGCVFDGTKWLENKQKDDPLVVVNGMLVDGAKCTGNVTVPRNVTRVNDYAFETGKTITGVEIPSSVTSIGKNPESQ